MMSAFISTRANSSAIRRIGLRNLSGVIGDAAYRAARKIVSSSVAFKGEELLAASDEADARDSRRRYSDDFFKDQ